ncbi:MAG: EAL domain-containing protein [Bacillota bacterium]|nr:EAL domain-containing protein [Bacillota bacterium]
MRDQEKKLEIQESYFKFLFNNLPDAIAVLDNDFNVININKSFQKLFLFDQGEIENKNITTILCNDKLYSESMYIRDCISNGEFVRKETLRRRKNGTFIDVSILGYPIVCNEERIGVYFIYSDLSRVREEEHRKNLFSEIFKNNTVGVVITDVYGKIQWINNAFTEITGYTTEEVEGKTPSILKSGKHDGEYYSNMWNSMLNTGKWQGLICNKRKNGDIYEEWLNVIAVKDNYDNIEYFVGMLNDITDARQKEKKIEFLTSKDSLTNLYNREFFMNKLNYSILKGINNMAVLFIDIDDFKEINDNLGHLVGDDILKEFAVRLKTNLREQDIAARFGGDEFIILISSANDRLKVVEIAERILQQVSIPYFVQGNELHITASIGIANYPKDGVDSSTLIKNADIAMYRAKESKYDKIIFFRSALNKEVSEYFKIKNGLRKAILMNELFLEYQPVYNSIIGKIIGMEALLRWKYSNDEIMSPAIFIPIAEKSGMIYSIGEWVLRKACEQNKAWYDEGYKSLYVAVNVSILQLEQDNFPSIVKKVLEDTGLNPRLLELEITETIFTKNYDKIVQTIAELKEIGLKIAIDDFGIGYSSLGKLSELDIHRLKIDKSFINGVDKSRNKRKIVRAIISMADSLNLDITAEGVEEVEQLDFLIRNGCSIIQGYIFSKPVAAKAFENLLKKTFGNKA